MSRSVVNHKSKPYNKCCAKKITGKKRAKYGALSDMAVPKSGSLPNPLTNIHEKDEKWMKNGIL